MNSNNPAALRALYIILVPVVLLIILLNSGWLQRVAPAANVNGESYTVVEYNYYYFDYYNSFLEENTGRLAELGYDPERSASEQTREDGLTWKEFFQRQGEAGLAETAYYYDLAVAAGYQFSEEELAPVRERLAEHAALQAEYGITASNYYVSYYGAGMTEESYTEHLTRQVKAQAYKDYLIEAHETPQSEIDGWLAANPRGDYRSVELRVITLEAAPDRGTGEVGGEQLAALQAKLAKLEARYEGGASFEQLQAAYSTCALGNGEGAVSQAIASDLPGGLADLCMNDQDGLTAGSTLSFVDGETGIAYFAVIDGFGGFAGEREADLILGREAVESAAAAALMDGYQVERNGFGMLMATA